MTVAFPKDKRRTIGEIVKERSHSPGPGSYTLPSDFGYSIDRRFLNKLLTKMKESSAERHATTNDLN